MTTWKVPWRISMIQLDLRNRKVQWIFGWKVRHCTLMYCRKGTLSSNILLMEEIWWIVYPTIYKVLCIPGGAGFLPSTAPWVVICDRSQEKSLQICTSPITDAFVRLWNDGLVEVTVNLTSVICFRWVGWTHNKNRTQTVTFLDVGPEVWYLIIFHMFYNYKRKLRKSDVGSTTFPLRRRLGGETHVMCGLVLSFFGLCCWSQFGVKTRFLEDWGESLVGFFVAQHEPLVVILGLKWWCFLVCFFGILWSVQVIFSCFWACPKKILTPKHQTLPSNWECPEKKTM